MDQPWQSHRFLFSNPVRCYVDAEGDIICNVDNKHAVAQAMSIIFQGTSFPVTVVGLTLLCIGTIILAEAHAGFTMFRVAPVCSTILAFLSSTKLCIIKSFLLSPMRMATYSRYACKERASFRPIKLANFISHHDFSIPDPSGGFNDGQLFLVFLNLLHEAVYEGYVNM